MSRQASRPRRSGWTAFSCIARNGLSAAAGLRFSRTCSAMALTGAINGLASEKSSYCSRSGCSCRIHSADGRRGHGAHHRLRKGAIEREIDLRHARRRREAALVRRIVAAERADVVERPRLAAHDPVAGRRGRGWPCPPLLASNTAS